MAAAPARFTFDLDLGKKRENSTLMSDSAMQAMLHEARMDGFAQGFAEGESSISAKTARVLASAAEALADRAAALNAALDDNRQQTLTDAVELAASIGRKLALHLLAREPTAEIEALIEECMASLDGVPHLVIRCHVDLADAVREIAEARMQTSGFSGRLVVLGEPDITLGDCRIEWVDGGLVRDVNAISAQINSRIAAYLAARGRRPSEESAR